MKQAFKEFWIHWSSLMVGGACICLVILSIAGRTTEREPYVWVWAECPNQEEMEWEGCVFGRGETNDVIQASQRAIAFGLILFREGGPVSILESRNSELWQRAKNAGIR